MGGTIARLAEQGHHVHLLDITNGEPTPFGDPETRATEATAAAKILGVDRTLLGFPNRYVENTLELRHAIAGEIRRHQAQIIFAPYFEDAHPDHLAVTQATIGARFAARLTKVEDTEWGAAGPPIHPKWLFFYYAMHLRKVHNPNFLFDISGYQERKIESIRAYHTQFVLSPKNRKILDGIDAMATYFGSRLGTTAAEPFFTQEPLGLTGLDSVLMG
ncbi:MAG: PIG-L deacetylase family protein [Planctomycetota bacterium]